ncbi:MAG TPA: OmpA family protein, partial [Humidesulfovibrio sp.]|uniref:OmpA family protein n=1 Tax=Humidesulfovibrio sp. TaxID=2910988 RepID=UPI002CC80C75
MSMRKRLFTSLMLAALMALVLAVQAPAETLKPKVDNFILFVDYSGSMAMTSDSLNTIKIKHAKELIGRMNAEIPALNYQGGVATFAPYEVLLAPKAYDKAAVAAANAKIKTDYEIYGRNTPMGLGLKDLDPVLSKFSGKTALIIFTDGDSNYGMDPVAEAKALYAKYPNLCIHVVSYADNARGKMVIDEIRAISRCTVAGDAKGLSDAGALKKFVKDVFYDVEADAPARAMAPAKAECETITFGNLNFGFDKFQITKEMEPALEQALTILKDSKCQKFTIEGHTDNVGGVPYNQKLSERRAASVAKWLSDHGLNAARLNPV